jgi:hypothetical protein
MMKATFLIGSIALMASTAFAAEPQCTTESKSKWQDQAAFQEKLKADGYEIKKFKVTSGNCYEIYGWNKEKQKVEIYFDPVSGKAIKTKIE